MRDQSLGLLQHSHFAIAIPAATLHRPRAPSAYGFLRASVVRKAGNVRAEFSTVDVVLTDRDSDRAEARARFALPPDIVRVGPAVAGNGAPYVLLYQAIRSGILDDGRWLKMPLSVS